MAHLSAPWVSDSATGAVFGALAGYGAWFVGGCVRDGLLGRVVDDIDICTDARPEQVMAAAEDAGLRAIPTGIDHGTVTVVSDGRPYEITTLRRDIETDGRHARVAFSDRLEDDAARRDFTMNALYADPSGAVLDPNGTGLADLEARRLRFIGAPEQRIAEDYLRILRFFRFHAWYGAPAGGIDAEGLSACAAGVDGLAQLSRERVGIEVCKLLSAPDPAPSVAAMAQAGVLGAVLPGADARLLPVLVHLEAGGAPDAMRRLAVLGGDDVPDRLRLSKAEAARLALLRDQMALTDAAGALGYRHGEGAARDILLLRGVLANAAPDPQDLLAAAGGAAAIFPVKATDLMPDLSGPALGAALRVMEERWIASGFALSKDALLRGR